MKTNNNHVEAFGPDGRSLGIIFETATPFDTPRLMAELVETIQGNLQSSELHPLITIAFFILPGATENTKDDSHFHSQLATMGNFFLGITTATKGTP